MAPKKPTMLQRQRALRKQQQQTKQQSAKQLPPKGQTSANTRQARVQRTSSAKAQAANQQRVIARGMEGFVRRGQAMDKLDKAAKGTQGSGTRTAGAGGGLAKRQSSAVATRQSGKPATTGGRVQPSVGGSSSSNRVQPVRVRDLGTTKPNQMGGNTPRALPPGRTGGAITRSTSGAGAAARGVASTAASSLGSRFASGLGAFATAAAIAQQAKDVLNPKDNIITRGAALGRSIERVVGGGGGGNATPAQRAALLKAKRGDYAGPGGKADGSGKGQVQQTTPRVNKARQDQMRAELNRDFPLSTASQRRGGTQPGRDLPQTRSGNNSPRNNPPAADRRSSSGGNNTAPRSQTPPAPRFTGTVDEGRKMWAEKYSSAKYDGQAIQKEAKKLMDEMKKRKEDKSNATKAGWDGNKNY